MCLWIKTYFTCIHYNNSEEKYLIDGIQVIHEVNETTTAKIKYKMKSNCRCKYSKGVK